MCADLSHLNNYIKRVKYQSATLSQAVADITNNNAKIFTKLNAHWTKKVSYTVQEIQAYLGSIWHIIQHWMDEAFTGLTGYWCIVDDVIICDSEMMEHTNCVRQFL